LCQLICLENSPGLVVNGGVDKTARQQFVSCPCDVCCVNAKFCRNVVLVQTLVRLRRFFETLEYALGNLIITCQVVGTIVTATSLLLPSAIGSTCGSTCICAARRSASEEEMDCRSFKKVVRDLVHILNRPDDLGNQVSPVREASQLSPCSAVDAFNQLSFCWVVLISVFCVRPLLDLYTAGAVVESERGVGGLVGDVAYLANNGQLVGQLELATHWTITTCLRYLRSVDLEGIIAAGLILGI
jgi:hypothetical protein